MIEVTIWIFSHSRPEMVQRCLELAHENTHIPHRLVVFHDGPDPIHIKEKEDMDVETWVFDERLSIGRKKDLMVKNTRTPYLTKLDCDIETDPFGIDMEVLQLNEGPDDLGAVSSLRRINGVEPRFCGVGHFINAFGCIWVEHIPVKKIRSHAPDLFYGEMVAEGLCTFKMKMFKEVYYDPEYELGYSHPDLFLQMKAKGWKTATLPYMFFNEVKGDYVNLREKRRDYLDQSRALFYQKWGLKFADAYAQETRPRLFYRLNSLLGKVWARL